MKGNAGEFVVEIGPIGDGFYRTGKLQGFTGDIPFQIPGDGDDGAVGCADYLKPYPPPPLGRYNWVLAGRERQGDQNEQPRAAGYGRSGGKGVGLFHVCVPQYFHAEYPDGLRSQVEIQPRVHPLVSSVHTSGPNPQGNRLKARFMFRFSTCRWARTAAAKCPA